MSRSRVLLITIEDLHWADQATLDVIQALASQRMQTKLIVVATLRNTVASDASPAAALARKLSLYRLAREISLEPLGAEDVAAFLNGLGKSTPPMELVTHLHARSEGNPLFMRAMLDLLVQRSLVSWDQGGWHLHHGFQSLSLRAPQSLMQIIEAEIGDLPLEAQAVLEGGSISDGAFSPAIHHVATALDEEAFESVCEDLARRTQLIRRHDIVETPDGKRIQTYAFCHSLFQEVAYDRQGANRRAQRHAAVAARLATLFAADFAPIASNLARHSIEAALWPEAIAYLRAASKTAVLRFALREAATSLERAIALTAKLPARERAQSEMLLVEDLARIYLGALDRRAVEAYDRLVHLARDAGRVDVEARALFGLGYVVSWTDASRSLSILSEAVEKSAQVDDPVQRRLQMEELSTLAESLPQGHMGRPFIETAQPRILGTGAQVNAVH